MGISNETIEAIKSKLSIVDVVSEYVQLKKSGQNMKGLCPFHIEKTPSFFVNEEKGVYHCFGCGASGNMFTFIMNIEKLSFNEAVEFLAKKAGVEVKYTSKRGIINKTIKEQILTANKLAAEYYHNLLLSEKGREAREYLFKRGLKEDTINLFKLGFAPPDSSIFEYLKNENVKEDIIYRTGLVIKSEKRNYDRLWGRIIFPIIDWQDNIIGFGGRIFKKNDERVKYLNTPLNEVFNKRSNFYGINLTRHFIREKKEAIVVEGYFDVISLYQAGVKNVVAPLGTTLTEEHVLLLKRFADSVIITFDSDTAGENATRRSISLLLKTNIKIKVTALPPGVDPDEFIKNYGTEKFQQLINNSFSFIKFIISEAFKKYNPQKSEGKSAILNEVFSVIIHLTDEILKADILSFLAQKLNLREEVVYKEFEKYKKGFKIKLPSKDTKPKISPYTELQRVIMILLLMVPSKIIDTLDEFGEEYFDDYIAREIYKLFVDFINSGTTPSPDEVVSLIEDENIRSFITGELLSDKYKGKAEILLEEAKKRFKLEIIKKKIEEIKSEIRKTTDTEVIRKLENQLQQYHLMRTRLMEDVTKK